MIIYSFSGRLGNQIFQYAFLKTISGPNETLILVNLPELNDAISLKLNGVIINNVYLIHLFNWIISPILLDTLSKILLITTIIQDNKVTSNGYNVACSTYSKKTGLLPITYVKTAYYQSEKFFLSSYVKKILKIRDNHISVAKEYISNISPVYHKIFVHIRRGDYFAEEYFGKKDVRLPLSYYFNQIDWFIKNVTNPFFIFISDDNEYIRHNFKHIEPKLISNNKEEVDFAIMTLCHSAIISNSSFSWWGAYLMEDRYKVFSPKYWLGFKSRIEYPQDIQPAFADIVDVECELTT